MSTGDAVQHVPTVADEMAKFSGFAVKDGETIDVTKEDLNPMDNKGTTDAEARALASNSGKKEAPAAKVVVTSLTDAESETVLSKAEEKAGRPLTDEEAADALAAARTEKAKPEGGKSRSVQQRINQAIRGRNAAEARATAAEGRMASMEARLAAMERGDKAPLTGDAKPANNGDVAPDPKDFEFGDLDAGYIRALARFETKQELAADRTKQTDERRVAQERQNASVVAELARAFEDAGADKFDDFEEVVMQGARDKAWPLSETLGAALLESDFGPDVAYKLASDPKLAKEIAALPPLKQVAWLGKQEAEFDAGSGDDGQAEAGKSEDKPRTGKEPPVTKAPAPVQRARGTGASTPSNSAGYDFAAFEAEAMGRAKQ